MYSIEYWRIQVMGISMGCRWGSRERPYELEGVGRKRQRRYTGKPLFELGLPKRPVPG